MTHLASVIVQILFIIAGLFLGERFRQRIKYPVLSAAGGAILVVMAFGILQFADDYPFSEDSIRQDTAHMAACWLLLCVGAELLFTPIEASVTARNKYARIFARANGLVVLLILAFSAWVHTTNFAASYALSFCPIRNEIGVQPDVTLVAADGFADREHYGVRYRVLCFYWERRPCIVI